MSSKGIRHAVVAGALLLVPPAAIAKDDLARRANQLAEQANEVQAKAGALAQDAVNAQAANESRSDDAANGRTGDRAAVQKGDDGSSGKLGLLGLLGLAGLLGLRKTHHVRPTGTSWDPSKDPEHQRRTGQL